MGIFNVHLKMGLVEEQRLALMNEKEGGTVVVLTNPVDDRIENPTSESKIRTRRVFISITKYTVTYISLFSLFLLK